MGKKLKSIAVYCGHEFGNNKKFKRDAAAVGKMLAQNGIRMVFGGGDVGLMGAVATADRKSTRLNSSHMPKSRMPSSA